MYADKNSRGGILGPPGICEVKYREQEQRATMHRLDPVLLELDESLAACVGDTHRAEVQAQVAARERLLLPLYLQVAHEFADLHDRAGRMKAKGCVSGVLEWRTARSFFHWRIRRRQAEDAAKQALVHASGGTLSTEQAAAKVCYTTATDCALCLMCTLPHYAAAVARACNSQCF
jgi:acetyl-CoA carboxylase/biotin carboxylase 1